MDVLVVALRSAIAQDPVLSFVAAGFMVAAWVVLYIQYRIIREKDTIQMVSVYLYVSQLIVVEALISGMYETSGTHQSMLLFILHVSLMPFLIVITFQCYAYALEIYEDELDATQERLEDYNGSSMGWKWSILSPLLKFFLLFFLMVLVFEIFTLALLGENQFPYWWVVRGVIVALVVLVTFACITTQDRSLFEIFHDSKESLWSLDNFFFWYYLFIVTIPLANAFIPYAFLLVLFGLVHQFWLLCSELIWPSEPNPDGTREGVGALSFLKMAVNTAAVWFWYWVLLDDPYYQARFVSFISGLTQSLGFLLYILIWCRDNWTMIKKMLTSRFGP